MPGSWSQPVLLRSNLVLPLNLEDCPSHDKWISDLLALLYIRLKKRQMRRSQVALDKVTKDIHTIRQMIANKSVESHAPFLRQAKVLQIQDELTHLVAAHNVSEQRRRRLTDGRKRSNEVIAQLRTGTEETEGCEHQRTTLCPYINRKGSFAGHYCSEDGIYRLGEPFSKPRSWLAFSPILAAVALLVGEIVLYRQVERRRPQEEWRGLVSLVILAWAAGNWLSAGLVQDFGFDQVWNDEGSKETYRALCDNRYQ